MRADPARYEVAPRGSAKDRQEKEDAKHLMHMKADPRYDMLNDGSGHNADADGQTLIGIEIHERFNDMRSAFLKIDSDFDGKITREELMDACHKWNIPLSEAQRVMNCTDLDKKGFIDFDEFARRFDPYLEITADDEEILRLYQEGIMGNEQPLPLSGVRHGTSTAEPLIDEAAHYRDENGDLRGRLARSMKQIKGLEQDLSDARSEISDLKRDLKASRSHAATLEGRNADLEARNADLTRRLNDAEDDRRRAEERAKRLAGEAADEAGHRRDLEDEERRRMLRRLEEEDAERRRRERELERELAVSSRPREQEDDDEEARTVFVYGVENCQKTQAVQQALKKAQVPFKMRDFNKDKRFMKALRNMEDFDGGTVYAPVVCLGNKAWWQKLGDDTQMIPFPQAVAMDLRHELGLNKAKPEKVRVDVDIDMEMYQRFLSMQEAFLKLDDDKDGLVTEAEIERRCIEWNIPVSEARRVIAEADRDAKGALDFNEFAKRFDSIFNRGSRGALRGLAPAPNQPRPKTSPPAAAK
jgi:Ca2+-binding EF-hand superfamily protein